MHIYDTVSSVSRVCVWSSCGRWSTSSRSSLPPSCDSVCSKKNLINLTINQNHITLFEHISKPKTLQVFCGTCPVATRSVSTVWVCAWCSVVSRCLWSLSRIRWPSSTRSSRWIGSPNWVELRTATDGGCSGWMWDKYTHYILLTTRYEMLVLS